MWLPCNKSALLESNECIKMSVFLKKHNVQTLLFILLFMRRNRLLPPLRLELKELKVNLGEGNFIFAGSSTDEWATNVLAEWIEQVLDYCDNFDNRYLFQSKNPARFLEYLDHPVMRKSVLCTTLEANRFYSDIMRNRLSFTYGTTQ